ncbi:hypothetical protein PENTCL1PPCAC_28248, partial [Pristionchus entomophagus]
RGCGQLSRSLTRLLRHRCLPMHVLGLLGASPDPPHWQETRTLQGVTSSLLLCSNQRYNSAQRKPHGFVQGYRQIRGVRGCSGRQGRAQELGCFRNILDLHHLQQHPQHGTSPKITTEER